PRPSSTHLFPYTTLFRSRLAVRVEGRRQQVYAALGARPGRERGELGRDRAELGPCALQEQQPVVRHLREGRTPGLRAVPDAPLVDRKSTRLNSSHVKISY